MERFICTTCGTQYPPSEAPRSGCAICQEERQFVLPAGQKWTTDSEMQAQGLHNQVEEQEPGLWGIWTQPQFAIGQRALLLCTPSGNVLWDCVSLLDEATAEAVQRLGGIRAIAISHPHYYSAMAQWAERFGAVVHVHAADRQWVMYPSERLYFWHGDTLDLLPGVTLLRLGGHFDGSAVCYSAGGAGGKGVLMVGDTLQVLPDCRRVGFMYSYPNYIPLPGRVVQGIAERLQPLAFDRIYGFSVDKVIDSGAKAAVRASAERYLRALL